MRHIAFFWDCRHASERPGVFAFEGVIKFLASITSPEYKSSQVVTQHPVFNFWQRSRGAPSIART